MNFIQYLLLLSLIINLYYLYNYVSLFDNLHFQNVIPETEDDYPKITKQNLRGMSKEVKSIVKVNIIDTLIREHWNSIYNGVILASGQDNITSYTVSLNCYKHLAGGIFTQVENIIKSEKPIIDVVNGNNKQWCHLFGTILPISDRGLFHHMNYVNKALMIHPFYPNNYLYHKTLYVPQRDLKFEESTLTNINLAKRRIIQFNLNATEIEDIVETEIKTKIIETFPDVNITKTYSECCQKIILNW